MRVLWFGKPDVNVQDRLTNLEKHFAELESELVELRDEVQHEKATRELRLAHLERVVLMRGFKERLAWLLGK